MKANITDDITGNMFFGGGGDTHRFIESDIQGLFLLAAGNQATIYFHYIAGRITVTHNRRFIIQQYTAGFDQFIRFPPGTIPGIADEFIEANGIRQTQDFLCFFLAAPFLWPGSFLPSAFFSPPFFFGTKALFSTPGFSLSAAVMTHS